MTVALYGGEKWQQFVVHGCLDYELVNVLQNTFVDPITLNSNYSIPGQPLFPSQL